MAAESEPASGSVMAIAAQRPAYRLDCSSSATEAIAELPRPWPGSASRSPTSPQHISMMLSTVARLEPLRLEPSSLGGGPLPPPTPVAPAPLRPPPSSIPSISAASMSSSLGRSCSAVSYLREIGRSISVATPCACSISGSNFFGVSRLIIRRAAPLP